MNSRHSLRLIILTLITLVALATTFGMLAMLLVTWLSDWPPLTRRRILLTATTLLVGGGAGTLTGVRLLAAWRAWRGRSTTPTAEMETLALDDRVNRRDFLKFMTVKALLGGATVAGVGYITRITPHRLQVEEVEVPIDGLSSRLDGLRIVQLSDLHLSKVAPLEYIQRAVATAQSLAGDLIVITGDYDTASGAHTLAGLHAPLGVYAILGNHDHWNGATQVADALTAAGLTLLRNQGQPIARDGGDRADLWLAGLDDVWERQDDLDAALRDAPDDLPILLLVHEPDYADRVADRAADLGIFLQLSGHSHGGQVRLPLVGAPILPYLGKKYPQGLQQVGQMWVYTNRGIGMTMPAVRFNCPPEITALTLRRAQSV